MVSRHVLFDESVFPGAYFLSTKLDSHPLNPSFTHSQHVFHPNIFTLLPTTFVPLPPFPTQVAAEPSTQSIIHSFSEQGDLVPSSLSSRHISHIVATHNDVYFHFSSW